MTEPVVTLEFVNELEDFIQPPELIAAEPGAVAKCLIEFLVGQKLLVVNLHDDMIEILALHQTRITISGEYTGDRWQEAARLLGIAPELMHDERMSSHE